MAFLGEALFHAIAFLVIFALSTSYGLAQSIKGRVMDSSGSPIAKAKLSLYKHADKKENRRTDSNDSGNYAFSSLHPGTYDAKAEASGFKGFIKEGIVVEEGKDIPLDFTLEVGSATEVVTVSEAAPLVEIASGVVGTTFDATAFKELPFQGRNIYNLFALAPGVSGQPGATNMSISGSGILNNSFSIEGSDTTNISPSILASGALIPTDSIQEFGVQQSTLKAEYGRTQGGSINVVTKSGSNAFHGSLFYSLQNDALNARNFFDFRKNVDKTNQFGFSLEGPIIKDRLFYFGSYQGQREKIGQSVLDSAPTLSSIRQAANLVLARGFSLNDLSVRILQLFPQANASGSFNNFYDAPIGISRQDSFVLNLELRRGRHDFDVRYNFGDGAQTRLSTASPFARFAVASGNRVQVASLVHTFAWTRKVNRFRVGYSRGAGRSQNRDSNFDARTLGLVTGNEDLGIQGLPLISITGFGALGSSDDVPSKDVRNVWTMADNLSLNHHGHSIKIGADFQHSTLSSSGGRAIRGRIFFDGTFLGDALADFLAGMPSSRTGVTRGDTRRDVSLVFFAWFIQDDFTIRRRLALNLGLRYEVWGRIQEEFDRLSNFLPTVGLVPVGSSLLPEPYGLDLNNFAPRIGFAWDVLGNGRLAVRGGWGLTYDPTRTDLFLRLASMSNSTNSTPFINPAEPSGAFSFNVLPPIPFGIGIPILEYRFLQTPISLFAVDPGLVNPLVQQFSLNIQWEKPRGMLLQFGYVGSRGRDLFNVRDINQPTPGDRESSQLRRPFEGRFPNFGVINRLGNEVRSNYNSFYIQVERRLTGGFEFSASYNLSKSTDNGSGTFELPQDGSNLKAERSRPSFDRRHKFTMWFLYALPLKRIGGDRLVKFTDGWQVSGFLVLQSGLPFTPNLSFDNSGTGNYSDRPDVVPAAPIISACGTCFAAASNFSIPQPGRLGNAGRNTLEGPGFANFDFSLSKATYLLREKVKLRFTADFLNLLNHPSFGQPQNLVDHPAFGITTATPNVALRNAGEAQGGPRRIRLGLKFEF